MNMQSQMFQYGIRRHDPEAKVYLSNLPSILAAINNRAITNDTAIGCMVLIPAKLKIMVNPA